MYRRFIDLILVFFITAVAAGLVFVSANSSEVMHVMIGLPFMLVLPGYAITGAIFPKGTLDVPERATFSLGLSLAIATLSGFFLNLTPWGLQATSWAILLGSVSLGASGVALVRRCRATGAESVANQSIFRINISQGALLGLAVLVTITAIVVARTGAAQQNYPGFTQLWILPDNEVGPGAVRVGMRSGESAMMRYRLKVEADGNVVLDSSSIELEPNESWESTVILPKEQVNIEKVEAIIYRLDAPTEIYRHVTLSQLSSQN